MYNKFEAKNIANDKVGNYQDNKRRDSRLLCLYGMFCFIMFRSNTGFICRYIR